MAPFYFYTITRALPENMESLPLEIPRMERLAQFLFPREQGQLLKGLLIVLLMESILFQGTENGFGGHGYKERTLWG